MAVSSMENGKITRWRAVEFSTGLITEDMKENTSTTRRKAMASSTGPTVVSTMVSGLMASSTAMVPTLITRDPSVMVSGPKANVSDG